VFCPNCKDEFRPGFTHCGRCNVDLVEDLAEVQEAAPVLAPEVPLPIRLGEYCGYLSLDEARHARDQLRREQIRTEIVLREPPDASWDEPVREEYWLRVDTSQAKRVAEILGGVPAVEGDDDRESDDDSFACGDCGQQVAVEELFCPGCGARFDD
jgi:hypothetical protein